MAFRRRYSSRSRFGRSRYTPRAPSRYGRSRYRGRSTYSPRRRYYVAGRRY